MAGRYFGPSFEWGQTEASKPANYSQWAEYESDRLGGYSKPDLINQEQYQNYLARQNNHASRMGGNLAAAGAAAAKAADPWASQRGQYQTSLSQLMNNPGAAMQNNPFFKWQQNQGLDAVNRKMAASGGRVSGNRMAALSDYAQNQSGQQFFQLADLYSLLGGAKNQNPAAAAQLQYMGAKDQAEMPLQWYQADASMTGASSPQNLANQAKKGFKDALNEQAWDNFNNAISYF